MISDRQNIPRAPSPHVWVVKNFLSGLEMSDTVSGKGRRRGLVVRVRQEVSREVVSLQGQGHEPAVAHTTLHTRLSQRSVEHLNKW